MRILKGFNVNRRWRRTKFDNHGVVEQMIMMFLQNALEKPSHTRLIDLIFGNKHITFAWRNINVMTFSTHCLQNSTRGAQRIQSYTEGL